MRTTTAAPIRMPWRISVYDDGVRVVLSPTAYRDTPTKEFVEFRVVRRWFARAHVLAFGLLLAVGAFVVCDQQQEAWGSTYQLKVTLRDASQRTLMDEFETPEQVERLKLAIASRLGIHNAHDRSNPSR